MGSVRITLFDMNKFRIEKQEEINLDSFFEKEISNLKEEGKNFLRLVGVEIDGVRTRVKDTKKFVRYILFYLFKDFEIVDVNGREYGHPDFILRKENEKIYLELKIKNDGIRYSQLKWFFENKEKNNKILWLDWEDDTFKLKETGDFL